MEDFLKYGAIGLTALLSGHLFKLILDLAKKEKLNRDHYIILFISIAFVLLAAGSWIFIEQGGLKKTSKKDKYAWVTYNRSGCSVQLPDIFHERNITTTLQCYRTDISDEISVQVDCSLCKIPVSASTFQQLYNRKLSEEGNIVYQIFKNNFFVVTGNKSNGRRYYHKALLKNNSHYLMSLEYPPKYQYLFDEIMTTVSRSFK